MTLLDDLTVPPQTLTPQQVPAVQSEWINKFSTHVSEDGAKSLACEVGDLVEKILRSKANSSMSSRFVVPEEAPCVLGLAKPAFYQIHSCLVNFTIRKS